MMAMGACQEIYDRGLTIPGDISVVGHDNLNFTRFHRPRLTTMDTHKFELGRAGVDLLLEEMASGSPLNKEVMFRAELVERESVSPPGRKT